MAITIVCPGCHKRFSVSDNFAGQSGPCPKCKTVIKIPEKSTEVKGPRVRGEDHGEQKKDPDIAGRVPIDEDEHGQGKAGVNKAERDPGRVLHGLRTA